MAELSLSMALTIAEGALAWARTQNYKPLSVVVLDAGGHSKVVLREDGTGFFGVSIASAKASGIVGFNLSSSRILAERFDNRPGIVAALSVVTCGQFMPGVGGRQIRDQDGALLGSVAAAGALPDEDEAAVVAGLAAAGLE